MFQRELLKITKLTRTGYLPEKHAHASVLIFTYYTLLFITITI